MTISSGNTHLTQQTKKTSRSSDRNFPFDRIAPKENWKSNNNKLSKQWEKIKNDVGLSSLKSDKRFSKLSGKGIRVAVLDSGFDYNPYHFERKTILTKQSFGYIARKGFKDDLGHGTLMTGIISSKFSMSPNAKVVHRKIYGFNSTNPFQYLENALYDILNNEISNLPDIINLSLGDKLNYDTQKMCKNNYGGILYRLRQLEKNDVIIVASAGNSYDGNEGMSFPGISKSCISVGALKMKHRQEFEIMNASQRIHKGKHKTNVFAPGQYIPTTDIDQKKGLVLTSGTSAATALVSSAITLLKEYYIKTNRNKSLKFNRKLINKVLSICQTPSSINGNFYRKPNILNIYNSLEKLDQFIHK